MSLSRRTLLHLVLLAAALAVPLSGDIYYTRFATQIAMYGMAACRAICCSAMAGWSRSARPRSSASAPMRRAC